MLHRLRMWWQVRRYRKRLERGGMHIAARHATLEDQQRLMQLEELCRRWYAGCQRDIDALGRGVEKDDA